MENPESPSLHRPDYHELPPPPPIPGKVRMRVVGWQVMPVIMADDGVNLESVPVNPMHVPAAQWKEWKASGGDRQALENLRLQVEEGS